MKAPKNAAMAKDAVVVKKGEKAKKGVMVKIKEAWAIDCPNHGEAAALNEEMLMRPEYSNHCKCVHLL